MSHFHWLLAQRFCRKRRSMCPSRCSSTVRVLLRLTILLRESIATAPRESDLDEEQIRALLASPLYLQQNFVPQPVIFCLQHKTRQKALLRRTNSCSPRYLPEREASADRSQVSHSVRENLVSSSPQVPKSMSKPVALFSSKRKSSQETCSDSEDFSSEPQQVLINNEPPCRLSNPENSFKPFLEEHEEYMLAEANSQCESMKAEQIISTVLFL